MNLSNLPIDDLDFAAWALYRQDKMPRQTNGQPAKVNDSSTWSTFDAVRAVLEADASYLGAGFILSEQDPHSVIDLDGCLLPDGTGKPWLEPILTIAGETYIEVSMSRTGLHVFVRGKLSGSGCHTKYQDGAVGIFSTRRFIAMTGNLWHHAPREIADCPMLGRLQEAVMQPKAWSKTSIEKGSRHHDLASIAGTLKARGLPDAMIRDMLTAANKHIDEPLPQSEIDGLMRQVERWKQ